MSFRQLPWLVYLLGLLMIAPAQGGLFKKKPVAHVFVGDIQPTSEMKQKGQAAINAVMQVVGDQAGGQAVSQVLGVDIKNVSHPDPYVGLDPLMKKKIEELEANGYKVKVHDATVPSEIKKHLTDKRTKAVVWFGHGDGNIPGSVHTVGDGGTLTPSDIQSWAQEKIAKQWGWEPKDSKDKPDLVELIKKAPREEHDAMRKQWQNASLNLDYGYFHTCHGFDNEDLAKVLMNKNNKDARFQGFQGVKWGWDEAGAKEAVAVNGQILIVPPEEADMIRNDADDYFKRQSLLDHGEESTVSDLPPLNLEEMEVPIEDAEGGYEMEHLSMPSDDIFGKVGESEQTDFKTMEIMNKAKQQETIGKQADQQSQNMVDKAGGDAQAIGQAAAAKSAKADMDNSWSKVWGEVIETSIGAGMSAAGGAAGTAAGSHMVDDLFPPDETPTASVSTPPPAGTPAAATPASTPSGQAAATPATTTASTKGSGSSQGGTQQGTTTGTGSKNAPVTTIMTPPKKTPSQPNVQTPQPKPPVNQTIKRPPLMEYDCGNCGGAGHVRTHSSVVPCMGCGSPVSVRPYSHPVP